MLSVSEGHRYCHAPPGPGRAVQDHEAAVSLESPSLEVVRRRQPRLTRPDHDDLGLERKTVAGRDGRRGERGIRRVHRRRGSGDGDVDLDRQRSKEQLADQATGRGRTAVVQRQSLEWETAMIFTRRRGERGGLDWLHDGIGPFLAPKARGGATQILLLTALLRRVDLARSNPRRRRPHPPDQTTMRLLVATQSEVHIAENGSSELRATTGSTATAPPALPLSPSRHPTRPPLRRPGVVRDRPGRRLPQR